MKDYLPDGAFTKKVFSFISDDRTPLEGISIGSKVSIRVRDKENKIVKIRFDVTRNTCLGKKTRWVYGRVLNSSDDEYYQIELKIHEGKPEMDTVEVFPQAPPIN